MIIGIIGAGNIGTSIAKHALREENGLKVSFFCEPDDRRAEEFMKFVRYAERVSMEEVIRGSDFIIECAHPDVVAEAIGLCRKHNKSIMVMSSIGLLPISEDLKGMGIDVIVPSGAIAGIDALKSCREARIDLVRLRTTKPPKALLGAPFIIKEGIELESLSEKIRVFAGDVEETSKHFPQNLNVAITLCLAINDFSKLEIELYADPRAKTNTHEIEISGSMGKIMTRTENMPSPDNRKTSYLAVLSAIQTLDQFRNRFRVGT